MSDEESFVILGSSPLPSMENDGPKKDGNTICGSLEYDTPGGGFSFLKRSQLIALQNAQEIGTQTPPESIVQPKSFVKHPDSLPIGQISNAQCISMQKMQISDIASKENNPAANEQKSVNVIENPSAGFETSLKMTKSFQNNRTENADIKLWSTHPLNPSEENKPFSLEDCVLKSPVDQTKSIEKIIPTKSLTNLCSNSLNSSLSDKKTTMKSNVENNLATSFIMGEVNADVLKTSVFSQFPSISMEASAEDVLKLQNMVTEYMQLKNTIKKANNTMKLFYDNSLQLKDKMQEMEKQLGNCQREIEELRKQNQQLESTFRSQMEALEIVRKKDREEMIQDISEKNSLLKNLRAEIIKLEQQQAKGHLAVQNNDAQNNSVFEKYYITREEHEIQIRNIESQLSDLFAANLHLKNVEKENLDELECVKVHFTAAKDLLKKHRAETEQLSVKDTERQKQIQLLEKSIDDLRITNAKQTERISLLEYQNEEYRKDFDTEQESRQTIVKEKTQILQDLRSLQRKNQELIAEHSKLAWDYEKRLSNSATSAPTLAAQLPFNNPQKQNGLPLSSSASMHLCPICNKAFKSLNILQSHVNDCLDKN